MTKNLSVYLNILYIVPAKSLRKACRTMFILHRQNLHRETKP